MSILFSDHYTHSEGLPTKMNITLISPFYKYKRAPPKKIFIPIIFSSNLGGSLQ